MVFSCSDGGMQSQRHIPSSNHWDAMSQITYNDFSNYEQIKLREDFRQRITGHEEATCNSLLSPGDFHPTHATNVERVDLSNSVGINLRYADPSRERQLKNQQRWILLLLHARRCMAPQGQCQEVHCVNVQQLLKHMERCSNVMPQCKYPRCHNTKVLVKHYKQCRDTFCPVCIPVKNFIERHLKSCSDSNPHLGIPHSVKNGVALEDLQTSSKRIKVEKPFHTPLVCSMGGSLSISVPPTRGQSHVPHSVACYEYPNSEPSFTPMKPELTEVKLEITCDMNKDNIDGTRNCILAKVPPSTSDGPVGYANMENTNLKARLDSDPCLGIPHSVKNGQSLEELQTSLKHIKVEKPFQPLLTRTMGESFSTLVPPTMVQSHVPLIVPCPEYRNDDPSCTLMKPELTESKKEITCAMNEDNIDDTPKRKPAKEPPSTSDGPAGYAKKENAKSEREVVQFKTGISIANAPGTKSGRQKIKGVSLTELFTPDQVREHIRGLRQWFGQNKAKAEKNQAMEHSMSENSCQLCAVDKLSFEPPPIYCTRCAARIKRNALYYTIGAGEALQYFCIPCYNESRGDSIFVDGTAILKRKLEKKKNDEETDEGWVQCDKCEAWQHQICALFNGRRNDGGQAEYTCPFCYISEVERGERNPLPQSAVLGANDLPRTILSDHIEQRLFKRLKEDRQDRARLQGKSYDEVPGAEALVVRVVASVDKKLEVKERFLEIFRGENYPTEFPYKSKVVLLFQRIEGVEVCLFAMYVQEFGAECQEPNDRHVYLSYLDSVKYFRPEIKTATGEALRTLVYHEILIGYLEYCKKRGFTSCYIWACPPLKGEDYILYCHPEIQKTPKSDKLREWYLCMLKKAIKENVAVDLTNLYDHFFVSIGDCKAKITAARLPYFDGDYWPGAAEDVINQLCQEEDGKKQLKKGANKKTMTKRALKACGQSDFSGSVSKDLQLMHKLGETIFPMKEDFIMVHLQHVCNCCYLAMVSGNRWVCTQCKNFQLCDKCYEAEQEREEKEKHPPNQRDKHIFYQVVIDDVPEDTKDKDDILESEFFDTRQTFLSLCQGNHYQYDTLRRAKHSSMMVLYHLHNPTAPAFVATCNVCHLDAEAGQSWRCVICPDFDVCNSCYEKNRGNNHPHKLTNQTCMADRDAQSKEARQLRFVQLRRMLDLLVHASGCKTQNCQYPKCQQVKCLFWHGRKCTTRISGGCLLCKKMWSLLQLHARACKDSKCNVPRCRDLKQHLRRAQQQSDSRRRAAVTEMMRQRAAEVAGNTG